MRQPGKIVRSIVWAVALGSLLATMGGCATVFRGDKQKVRLVTDPPGAKLDVDGKSYTSPTSVMLKRNKPHTVIVSKEGYQALTFTLKGNWDAGGAGAVVTDVVVPGGSILFAIDTLVGADRQFHELATIKLPPALGPTTEPTLVFERKGQLLNKADYDRAVTEDKLFAPKSVKGKNGTQPTTVPTEPSSAARAAQQPPGAAPAAPWPDLRSAELDSRPANPAD
jgi:PEGA domain